MNNKTFGDQLVSNGEGVETEVAEELANDKHTHRTINL